MSGIKRFFTPRAVAGVSVRPMDIVRAPYFRMAVLTTLAGSISYLIGMNAPRVSGVTAAIAAMVSMRHTFHDSIQESFRQVVGVVIGGSVGYVAIKLVGFNAYVIGAAIFASFVAARLMRLGEEGAMAIAVTVILVVGPNVSTSTIEQRFLGVILGAAIATFFSYFVRKGSPKDRALQAGIAEAHAMSDLLNDIASALTEQDGVVNVAQAKKWMVRAKEIAVTLREIKAQALSALEGSSWSPVLDRDEVQAVVDQIELSEATATTVINICRDLVMTSGSTQQMPALLATALAGVLSATAGVIEEQADNAEDHPAEPVEDELDGWNKRRDQAIAELRDTDETQPLLLGGSILRDAEKITEILS